MLNMLRTNVLKTYSRLCRFIVQMNQTKKFVKSDYAPNKMVWTRVTIKSNLIFVIWLVNFIICKYFFYLHKDNYIAFSVLYQKQKKWKHKKRKLLSEPHLFWEERNLVFPNRRSYDIYYRQIKRIVLCDTLIWQLSDSKECVQARACIYNVPI